MQNQCRYDGRKLLPTDRSSHRCKAFHSSCSQECKHDLEAWVMLLSLGGRVKPDHGERRIRCLLGSSPTMERGGYVVCSSQARPWREWWGLRKAHRIDWRQGV